MKESLAFLLTKVACSAVVEAQKVKRGDLEVFCCTNELWEKRKGQIEIMFSAYINQKDPQKMLFWLYSFYRETLKV